MDTVHLRFDSELVSQEIWEASLDKIEYEYTITNKLGYITYSGHLGNLKITRNFKNLYIKGSLTKFLLGDNCKTMSISDIELAIQNLSDIFGLPIEEAEVTRLDFAVNLLMNYPPDSYYKYLASAQHYKRYLNDTTLTFKNSLREFSFYDKTREMKYRRNEIPKPWKWENILRIELRIKNKVDKYFNDIVIASKLYEEDFYILVRRKWFEEYQKIVKEGDPVIDMASIKKPKDFMDALAYIGAKSLGLDNTLEYIEELKTIEAFKDKSQYSKLKSQINNGFKNQKKVIPNEFILELENKVKSVMLYYF